MGPDGAPEEDRRYHHEINQEPRWTCVTDLSKYTVIPTDVVAPLHVWCATGGAGHSLQGVVWWPTQTPRLDPLLNAVFHCFWDFGKEQLDNIARFRGLDVSGTPSLPGVLSMLCKEIYKAKTGSDLGEERLAEILSLRAVLPPDPLYDIISHQDLVEVSLRDDQRDLEAGKRK